MIQYLRKTAFIVAAVLFISTVSLFHVQATPTLTPGGLLTFTSQWEFEDAFPGLPIEDFEESPVISPGIVGFPEPLNDSTNVSGVFVPGDIQPGLAIQTVEGIHPSNGLFVIGSGHFSNSSKAVGINWSSDTMDILFNGDDVYAVGMDLMLNIVAASVTISIYGPGNTLLDALSPTIQVTETFFGVYSTQPITHITIGSAGQAEIVDNIQFGAVTSNLTLYTDQAAFESAHPGLPVEDFEESTIADTGVDFFAEPLDSSTSNVYFSPGDILEGLLIRTVSPFIPASALATVGGAYLGASNATKAIATHFSGDNLSIAFPGFNAYAVGMDLMFRDTDADATIIVYNIIGKILGVTTWSILSSSETFFGVYSNDLIGKIIVLNNIRIEFVDNIRFGGLPDGLTFYSTAADFKKARANLPWEDFSESPVVDNTTNTCNEPVDIATNQAGCFVPGDIVPNISFQTEDSLQMSCPACMEVYGANSGSLGNMTPMLAVQQPDFLEIAFSGKNVHYVGMDHYSNGLISVYGANDTLLGTAINNWSCGSAVLDFWGVSSAEPISRITFDGGGLDPAYLNEIWFGGKFPWPSFLPAINGRSTATP